MSTKGSAKLKILQTVFDVLSDQSKDYLLRNENRNDVQDRNDVPPGFYLLNLLRFPYLDLCAKLINLLLDYYDCEENIFNFNDQRIGMTLEDVLYLTGLPISGITVIKPLDFSHDFKAFQRLFGEEYKDRKSLTTHELRKIVAQRNDVNDALWKKAAMLLITESFIVPNDSGQIVDTTFCYFVEDLTTVNGYAWGVTLLSYLYLGIRNFKVGIKWRNRVQPKKSVDGNTWLLVCFVLIHIPKLREALGVVLDMGNIQVPLMRSVVEQAHKLGGDHRTDYTDKVASILDNLTEQEIQWSPYNETVFSGPYFPPQSQTMYGTLVAPLFCNNFVVHHTPYLVAKQFPVLSTYDLANIAYENYEIKLKKSCGTAKQNFKAFYEELKIWEKKYLAQNCIGTLPDHNQDECDQSEPVTETEADERDQRNGTEAEVDRTGNPPDINGDERDQSVRNGFGESESENCAFLNPKFRLPGSPSIRE